MTSTIRKLIVDTYYNNIIVAIRYSYSDVLMFIELNDNNRLTDKHETCVIFKTINYTQNIL
jgi:hypothetical protein